jgi:segregation and condensation protein B
MNETTDIQQDNMPQEQIQQDEQQTTAQAQEKNNKPLVLTPEEEQDLLRLLEALLFTASDMVTLNELQPFFPPHTPLPMLLERLETQYAERGIHVVQRGNGWGFRTAPDLGERLQIRKTETKPMSRPVIETLAIIAYHQPVTKSEIEQVRGVSVGKNVLETLLEQNLIKPGKRREVPGRPLTWVTSQNFLDMFSLTSLKDLPNLQEMKEQGLLTVTPPNFNLQVELNLEESEGMSVEDELDEDDDSDFGEDKTTNDERETA